MTKLTDDDLRRLIPMWEASDKVVTVDLARELLAARKVVEAAKLQLQYHPEDTIEALEISVKALVKEFGNERP